MQPPVLANDCTKNIHRSGRRDVKMDSLTSRPRPPVLRRTTVPKGLNKDSLETATGRLTAFAIGVCRSRLLLALVVGLCCSAGLVSTAGNALFNQAGSIDPYLYLGYIHDYPGLLSRFGPNLLFNAYCFHLPRTCIRAFLRCGRRLFGVAVYCACFCGGGGFRDRDAVLWLRPCASRCCLADLHALAPALAVMDIPRRSGCSLSPRRHCSPYCSNP